MDLISQNSCIRFIERTIEADYVIIKGTESGCSSDLGRQGDAQVLSLEAGYCTDKGTVLHELMHTLGFVHEQNRIDRDDYVQVNYDNVDPAYEANFNFHSDVQRDHYGQAYDYESVMHYAYDAF